MQYRFFFSCELLAVVKVSSRVLPGIEGLQGTEVCLSVPAFFRALCQGSFDHRACALVLSSANSQGCLWMHMLLKLECSSPLSFVDGAVCSLQFAFYNTEHRPVTDLPAVCGREDQPLPIIQAKWRRGLRKLFNYFRGAGS